MVTHTKLEKNSALALLWTQDWNCENILQGTIRFQTLSLNEVRMCLHLDSDIQCGMYYSANQHEEKHIKFELIIGTCSIWELIFGCNLYAAATLGTPYKYLWTLFS